MTGVPTRPPPSCGESPGREHRRARRLSRLAAAVALTLAAAPARAADLPAFVEGQSTFVLALYQKLHKQEGNLVLSPYGITEALAMTFAGAGGRTAEEMAGVLHAQDAAGFHASARALRERLAAVAAAGHVELVTANTVWPQAGFPLEDGFVARCRADYGVTPASLDYRADPDACAREISAWAAAATRDRIRGLVPPGALTRRTRLVLASAIYFKGTWLERFDRNATGPAPFRLPGGETVAVPTMHRRGTFGYAESEEFQVLEMPYVGGELAMVVLLPKKAGPIAETEAALTVEGLQRCCARVYPREVDAYLPRFRAESSFRLSTPLISLGMRDAFSETEADFSGMAGPGSGLYLSAVLHKAFLEVDEEGSEAAAATAVVVGVTSVTPEPPEVPVFRADRPFLFFIRDQQTRAILFAGRLADPRP